MELIQSLRGNLCSLFQKCGVVYEVTPLDPELYKHCVDDAVSRGYPVKGHHSVVTCLSEGLMYAKTATAHLSHRPAQVWIALYTSCTVYVDETADRFVEEMPNVYQFNHRFIRGEPQESRVLDAYADLLRRAPELFPNIASQLITSSTLNFVTANLLEHETKTMKILSAAQQYPFYQRSLSGDAIAYAFMVFSSEIPFDHYIQAIPELALFLANANDLLSFYKEELDNETMNHVSMVARRTNRSKLEVMGELTEATVGLYNGIVEILQGSPEACSAFKLSAGGYIRFHTSHPRYRLQELGL